MSTTDDTLKTKRQEQLEERVKRAEELLKTNREKLKNQERKTRARLRRMENHARFMFAGMMLEKIRDDPENVIWKRMDQVIADETFRKYDRECFKVLRARYLGGPTAR